jgi:hypothetical protein
MTRVEAAGFVPRGSATTVERSVGEPNVLIEPGPRLFSTLSLEMDSSGLRDHR